jgi:CelD/BcsL family acetyltransferase involved in cellulose biosynthesis
VPGNRAATRMVGSLVDSADHVNLSGIRNEWEELASKSTAPQSFYQSPAWWDNARALREGVRSVVAVMRGPCGSIEALAPTLILDQTFSLPLVLGLRVTQPLRVARILGDQPLVRPGGSYTEMFRFLLASNPDCDGIWLIWLPFDSDCWRAISTVAERQREFLVHTPGHAVDYTVINLPDSFEAYLNQFKRKTRYNLRRQVHRLRERGGELRCIRITEPEQVPLFLDAASQINAHGRVHKRTGLRLSNEPAASQRLAALADNGLMRSYLLKCGDQFKAFALGYQHRDTYYYHRIGFDDRLAAYSPGTVLLYLLLADLFDHRPPHRVNLGHGGAWSTGPFGTDLLPGTEVLLLRRNFKNRLWVAATALRRLARHAVRRH